MPGLGTLINVAAILLGGLIGICFGKLVKERIQQTMILACGVGTLFIGIAGALEKMFSVQDGIIQSDGTLMMIVCLALGSLVGELIDIDRYMVRFGEWLKQKSGNGGDKSFVNAFVHASFTVCIGAMAVIGSINDGIHGDPAILISKSILDFIIIIIFTVSLGKGSIFAAIPVGIFQGSLTALSRLIAPLLNDAAMNNLSLLGSVLIFCIGVNLIWNRNIKVSNMLPSLVFAVAWAFIF